jgi:hypothetical protein
MRIANEVDVLGQEAKIPIHSSRFLLRHLPCCSTQFSRPVCAISLGISAIAHRHIYDANSTTSFAAFAIITRSSTLHGRAERQRMTHPR